MRERKKGTKLLPAGKLPLELLRRLLNKYAHKDPSVIVGPSIGIDSAVIDFHGKYLIAKTDPITFVADDIGAYAILVNSNDIAVMGAVPKWVLATILLPQGKATAQMAQSIFAQINKACKQLDITLCGGHTEITPGIDRPIVVGHMLGEIQDSKLITGGGAQAEDDILLTKGIAIEAVSIIAREKRDELVKKFNPKFIARCKNFLRRPGLSVLKEALIAVQNGRVHAMHDPTEGGLSTGLHELAIASKCGILAERSSIPILPESKALCDYYGLDIMGAIASGALIISIDPEDTVNVIGKLKEAGIKACRIGKITDRKKGVKIIDGGKIQPLKPFKTDEITKIF